MNTDYKNRWKFIFFDLETNRSAAEVDAWANSSKMGMSPDVTHSERDGFQTRA
jgi:hypothetical protein